MYSILGYPQSCAALFLVKAPTRAFSVSTHLAVSNDREQSATYSQVDDVDYLVCSLSMQVIVVTYRESLTGCSTPIFPAC